MVIMRADIQGAGNEKKCFNRVESLIYVVKVKIQLYFKPVFVMNTYFGSQCSFSVFHFCLSVFSPINIVCETCRNMPIQRFYIFMIISNMQVV